MRIRWVDAVVVVIGGLLLPLGSWCPAGAGAPPAVGQDSQPPVMQSVPDLTGDAGSQAIPWRLVAQSDLVVRARITVPPRTLSASELPPGGAVSFGLTDVEALDGVHLSGLMQLKVLTGPAADGPTADDVAAYRGREAILFLRHPYDPGGDAFYFAGHTRGALLAASRDLEEAVRQEMRAQSELTRRVTEQLARNPPQLDAKVSNLLTAARTIATAAAAGEELMALDSTAVPALISRMDDRRLVARFFDRIPGANPPPYVVIAAVDLISIVLERITKESFGDLHNGGTEQQRRRVVAAWKVWLGRSMGW